MKRILVFLGGFLGYWFLEGFIRLIIMFYHRSEFHFYGISSLPDDSWIIIIMIAVLINTWLVSMMVLSILKIRPMQNAFIISLIFLSWRVFEWVNSHQTEPLWYFITIILLHFLAVFLAFNLYKNQNEITTHI